MDVNKRRICSECITLYACNQIVNIQLLYMQETRGQKGYCVCPCPGECRGLRHQSASVHKTPSTYTDWKSGGYTYVLKWDFVLGIV